MTGHGASGPRVARRVNAHRHGRMHGRGREHIRLATALLAALQIALLVAALACDAKSGGTGGATGGSKSSARAAAEGFVEIRGRQIPVEIAEGGAEQAKGLGERDALAWDTGMYFPYARAGFYSFWMKGMRFPIDIVFIREGRIVDLYAHVPFEPGGNGPTIRPRELADGVLEVPAGYSTAQGWRVGDRVRFERTESELSD